MELNPTLELQIAWQKGLRDAVVNLLNYCLNKLEMFQIPLIFL
jgi:hypothetical protein